MAFFAGMNQKLPQRSRGAQVEGLIVLIGIVAFMWLIEVLNTIDSNQLDSDGIIPRNLDRVWGIFTSPFIHASFQHLIDNTIPFIFMGVIIALSGAVRLLKVTLIVIVVGGIGTWLIGPSHSSTIGASGIVFGYASYLLVRGIFDRSALELVAGAVVAVVWGGALLSSLVPHYGISWQAHACGAFGGVVAAYVLSSQRPAKTGGASRTDPQSALDRALAK
jgi:membrane associated rhomboid family serine protease